MCRRIPNLDTAIEECKKLNKQFEWKRSTDHIKFYVEGKLIMLGLKKANPDKVRKDVRRMVV